MLSAVFSCSKEDDAAFTTLTIASHKGRNSNGAEWLYVKEKNDPGWMVWAYIPGFDNHEEGYEYKVFALKKYLRPDEPVEDGFDFDLHVTSIISKTQKQTEGLPDDEDVSPF